MIDIINLILFIVPVIAALRITYWLSKRLKLITRLYSLKRECGASVKFTRFPLLPTICISSQPDAIVEIGNTVYLIRLYSGGGAFSSVHFINEKYSAVYIQVKGATRARRAMVYRSSLTGGINIGTKVHILPEFKVPENIRKRRKINIVKVLLLNPAPSAMTYVTEEKTSIRIAFTGDEFYGMKVFTASTFVRYADRESRNPKKNEYPEFEYFEDFKN